MEITFATPAFLRDPYPTYRALQEHASLHWFAHGGPTGGMWLVTRYDDAKRALKDPRLSVNLGKIKPEFANEPLRHMLNTDPPDHTRLRGLVSQAFTPRTVERLEPHIVEIVDALLDHAAEKGELELMHDFALPLPVLVIGELLGVPEADRDLLHGWSEAIIHSMDAGLANEERKARGEQANQEMAAYFLQLIQARRQDLKDDLVSDLIRAHDDQGRLSDAELLGTCVLLLIAGHETTVNLIGNGTLTLLRHPEQLGRLRRHPELLGSAIEEMLRFESPVQRLGRFTLEPFEVAGQVIEPGQQLSVMFAAANRDPRQFPDPDSFDIARTPNRHLAFGQGIHFCLGSPLARLEARIAFERLLARFPDMRLVDEEPEWRANTIFRGLRRLPLQV